MNHPNATPSSKPMKICCVSERPRRRGAVAVVMRTFQMAKGPRPRAQDRTLSPGAWHVARRTSHVARLVSSFSRQLLHDIANDSFRVAEQHQGVVRVIEVVVDAGKARIHAALDGKHRLRLVGV